MEIETQRCHRDRPWEPVVVRGKPITPAESERMARLAAEVRAACERREAEEDDAQEEDEPDYYALQASWFQDLWNAQYLRYCGSFDDTTKVPHMRFTDKKPGPDHCAYPCTTLQVFSLKVTGIRGGLQWPLHVFGTVALRDSVDHNRNMIFNRTRDDCQTFTKEVPCFKLIGPTRAVVLLDPVTLDVNLKVKGATEAEDKDLSFLAVPFRSVTLLQSRLRKSDYTSKLSTLEFALGILVNSLEATIAVRVTSGTWPDGFRAQFAAHTTSIDCEEVILFDSGDDKVIVAGDGKISLSRCVASVEVSGRLKVSVRAWQGDKIVADKEKGFKPKKAGRSCGMLDVGFCKLDVSVAWSLVSSV